MTKSFKFQIKKEQEWGEKALRVLGEKASYLPRGKTSMGKPVISGANQDFRIRILDLRF